jgi:hypothetical protein
VAKVGLIRESKKWGGDSSTNPSTNHPSRDPLLITHGGEDAIACPLTHVPRTDPHAQEGETGSLCATSRTLRALHRHS